jgi:TatD DNase family protein
MSEPITLIDTHCHLHLLDGRPESIVARANADGVVGLVDVGIDLASSADAASNAARIDGVVATAGIHPHNAIELTPAVADRLEGLLGFPEVVGVGETGLDYYRDHSPPDVQRTAFGRQIRLARKLDKVLVIHCRDAFDDVVSMLDGEGAPERVVFHCFTGTPEMAARVIDGGWNVSFSGNVTFKNAPAQRESCAVVPLDRMVLETDSPFLTPHPHRGESNQPGRVALTAATVAEVHGTDVAAVATGTTATPRRLFRLPAVSAAG